MFPINMLNIFYKQKGENMNNEISAINEAIQSNQEYASYASYASMHEADIQTVRKLIKRYGLKILSETNTDNKKMETNDQQMGTKFTPC